MKLALIVLGIDIIILCVIYVLLRKRIDRAFQSTELLSQIEVEIDRVVTELNQTTDRNISLLEDRIEKLTLLIEQADKRMLLYQREREKEPRREAVVYTRPAPLKVTQVSLFDEETGTPAATASVPAETPAVRTADTGVKSTRDRVLELAGQRMEAALIASRLGITRGEVDLILSMSQRQKEKGNSQ